MLLLINEKIINVSKFKVLFTCFPDYFIIINNVYLHFQYPLSATFDHSSINPRNKNIILFALFSARIIGTSGSGDIFLVCFELNNYSSLVEKTHTGKKHVEKTHVEKTHVWRKKKHRYRKTSLGILVNQTKFGL